MATHPRVAGQDAHMPFFKEVDFRSKRTISLGRIAP
jgi:hypothetical protein